MAKKKKTNKYSETVDYEQIYRETISGWDKLSESDRELCRKVNEFRVKGLGLPPIIHPEVVHNNTFV